MPSMFTLPFLTKEQISRDAWSFYFDKKVFPLTYTAGQYIKMTLPIENPDVRGTTRFFTIASSPTEDSIMITTRLIHSSFKMKLEELKPGEEVQFNGPFGHFVLHSEDARPVVFVTGGIGITPFRSMSVFARDTKLARHITLLASYSTAEDVLFDSLFQEIAKDLPTFSYLPTVTKPEGSNWTGETGRIDKDKIQKFVANWQESLYYIVGPQPMVEAMIQLITDLKIPAENIIKENFPGY